MSYLPILFGLIAAIGWGLSDFIIAKPVRAIGHLKTTTYMFLFDSVFLVIVFLFLGFNINISVLNLTVTIAVGFINFLGFYFAFKAFRFGDLSITAPIIDTYPAITVILSVFVLGDKLSAIEALLIAVILLGVVLASIKFSGLIKSRRKKKFVALGVGSAVASALLLSLPGLWVGMSAFVMGALTLSLLLRVSMCLFGFLSSMAVRQNISVPPRKFIPSIAFAGILDGIAILAFVYGVSIESSSLPIIATLASLAVLVTVVLATILFKERQGAIQYVGITLAIAGTLLLTYIISIV